VRPRRSISCRTSGRGDHSTRARRRCRARQARGRSNLPHTDNSVRTGHTRIQSFVDQIAEGKRFVELLGPLEAELQGRLPGAFFLIVEVGVARVRAADHPAVRVAIVDWIMQNAAGLDPDETTGPAGHCDLSATPPGVPFQVTLHRDSDYESRLFIMQELSGQLLELRRAAIAVSLDRKCPKLKDARGAGCVSVLVLESNDISLANRAAVAEAVAAELSQRQDAPDVVIWTRTSTAPWKAALLKDGDAIYPAVDSRLFPLQASLKAA
jgi:hypothetical protein